MRWLVIVLVACAPKGRGPEPVGEEAPMPSDDPAVKGVTSPPLAAVLAEHWAATMERFPEWATALGDHRYDDRLFDPSEEALLAWSRRQQRWMLQLSAIPDDMLGSQDRA